MTITVIGHLCLDVIHHADGTETQSYGGIFFSVAALANLLGPGDTIHPVFGVGKDEYQAFIERLEPYPNVDTSGIYKFNGPTNQVSLHYKDKHQRIECSKHISEPIPLKKIRPYLDADMILINMISGFDITLETLDEIRMEVREQHTPVYIDIHSLTLGIKDDFTRFHRPVELWRRWLFMLHGAQMNEEEAAILATEKLDEANLAKHVLALNTKALIVTRGERGCTAYVDDKKHIHRTDIDGINAGGSEDPTGCGDVFAAAYSAHYLMTKDVEASANFANKVAAQKSTMNGSNDIDKLSSFRLSKSSLKEKTA
jgi:sugar/nucleoside kinase (ribokinase family)